MSLVDYEQRFVAAISLIESNNNDEAWGDDGCAVGAYQQHPSFFVTWGPTVGEFNHQEQSWAWAFRVAIGRFFRAAWSDEGVASLPDNMRAVRVAMAYHLHGMLYFHGWDQEYADRFSAAWRNLAPKV